MNAIFGECKQRNSNKNYILLLHTHTLRPRFRCSFPQSLVIALSRSVLLPLIGQNAYTGCVPCLLLYVLQQEHGREKKTSIDNALLCNFPSPKKPNRVRCGKTKVKSCLQRKVTSWTKMCVSLLGNRVGWEKYFSAGRVWEQQTISTRNS